MKKPSEWTEEDVQALIDSQTEESLQLEYKACGALQKTEEKKKTISTDVSSFANSAGGKIIYGVKEYKDRAKKHLPESIDEGFDPSDISKEWLEQVINSRIQPRIARLIINSVKLSGEKEGKCIYVVNIPQSHTAHQASDKRYYKRHNFQSVPMEDYEIRDIMNRRTVPDIEPLYEIKTVSMTESRHEYYLSYKLINKGHVLVNNWAFYFAYPKDVSVKDTVSGYVSRKDLKEDLSFYGVAAETEYIQLEFRSTGSVFFPSEEIIIFDRGLAYYVDQNIYLRKNRFKFYWILFADGMPRKDGVLDLEEISKF